MGDLMQIKLLALLIVICACSACAPDQKCSGGQVYDVKTETCTPCPKDAAFENDTCVCKAGYDFVNLRCVKGDAGMVSEEDAGPAPDAGSTMMASGGATCEDYCSFANTCIGMNALAGALGTLSADLHANDTAACKTSCQSDLGNKEPGNAAIACMKAAQAGAMCDDANPQNGLMGAFGVYGECCGTRGSDPLCKSICTTLTGNPIVGSMITFCP
jgi:hypothetical protein